MTTVLPAATIGGGNIITNSSFTTSTTGMTINGTITGRSIYTQPIESEVTKMAHRLEKVAARMDELSLEYDWPELVTLSEEIGVVSDYNDRQIESLEHEVAALRKEIQRLRDPREQDRERDRQERRYREDMMAYRYATGVTYPTKPIFIP